MELLGVILFVVGLVLILMGVLKFADYWKDYPHDWQYRNPYDRTCKKCGRNEQEECWADEYARYGMRSRGTWEVYREGDGSCEKKSKKL